MLLYTQVKNDIISGAYPYGSRLPSKRTMAERYGVSVISVEHAYELLCDEGYADARERSGYFVIYKTDDFFSGHDESGEDVTAAAETHTVKSEFPFSVLAKTMRRVLLDHGEKILTKSPNRGCSELRSAISHYLARSCGIDAKPEQIIIGSGAEYLYGLAVQLLGSDRIYAIEDPSYEKIRRVYIAHGVRCDMLKMGRDGIRTSELERTSATVLHITPFCSFPSGITAGASKRAEYIKWAVVRNGFIIEDNYDSELTVSKKNVDTVFSMSDSGNVIYLNTFSRTVAPSMRVGYMVLPESLLDTFEHKLGFYSCTVPVFEQYVLAELIRNGSFERHINKVRRARRRSGKNGP